MPVINTLSILIVQGLLNSLKDNTVGAMTRAYHSVYYVNGTECDITHKPRSARVEVREIHVPHTRTHTHTHALDFLFHTAAALHTRRSK